VIAQIKLKFKHSFNWSRNKLYRIWFWCYLARWGDLAKTLTPGSDLAQVAMAGWSVDTQRESKPPYWTMAVSDHCSKGRDPSGA